MIFFISEKVYARFWCSFKNLQDAAVKGAHSNQKIQLVQQDKNSNNRGEQANFCLERAHFSGHIAHPQIAKGSMQYGLRHTMTQEIFQNKKTNLFRRPRPKSTLHVGCCSASLGLCRTGEDRAELLPVLWNSFGSISTVEYRRLQTYPLAALCNRVHSKLKDVSTSLAFVSLLFGKRMRRQRRRAENERNFLKIINKV